MEIIQIHTQLSAKILNRVVKHLRAGGLIIYPTETAYGLGADAKNKNALPKIFELKQRAKGKPLSVIVGTVAMAKKLVLFSKLALALAGRYWPGPLTLILPAKKSAKLPISVLFNGMVALRISSHPVARAIAIKLKSPLIATSANRSGKGECYSIRAVRSQFKKIDSDIIVLNAGRLSKRKPSTVAKVTNQIEILRKGAIRL